MGKCRIDKKISGVFIAPLYIVSPANPCENLVGNRASVFVGREDRMKDLRKIKRGDIYYADLKEAKGSIQAGVRPVVVTQYNGLNKCSPTVIVAAITSQLKKTDAPYHVVLPAIKELPKQSMVLAEQRFTLNKSDLIEYLCSLNDQVMRDVTLALQASEREDSAVPYIRRRRY